MAFSSQDYSAALDDALQYAWSKGVVLVAATGNDGLLTATYPAGISQRAGCGRDRPDDNLYPASNTGSALVAAPGLSIFTTLPGDNYGAINGTSAAAAQRPVWPL